MKQEGSTDSKGGRAVLIKAAEITVDGLGVAFMLVFPAGGAHPPSDETRANVAQIAQALSKYRVGSVVSWLDLARLVHRMNRIKGASVYWTKSPVWWKLKELRWYWTFRVHLLWDPEGRHCTCCPDMEANADGC